MPKGHLLCSPWIGFNQWHKNRKHACIVIAYFGCHTSGHASRYFHGRVTLLTAPAGKLIPRLSWLLASPELNFLGSPFKQWQHKLDTRRFSPTNALKRALESCVPITLHELCSGKPCLCPQGNP